MNDRNDRQEAQLRELLGQVGQDAERRGPSFQRVWSAARRARGGAAARHGRQRTAWALASVVGAILLVGVGLHWLRPLLEISRVTSREPMDSALLEAHEAAAEEQTPTDFLLAVSNQPWPESITRLADQISELLGP